MLLYCVAEVEMMFPTLPNGGLDTKVQATAPDLQASPERLTHREYEVLALVAGGLTTKEIAARLGISFKTAACHRSHILPKTGSHNAVTLVLYAIRKGLIEP